MTESEREMALEQVDSMIQSQEQRKAYGELMSIMIPKVEALNGCMLPALEHMWIVKEAVGQAMMEWRKLYPLTEAFQGARYAPIVSMSVENGGISIDATRELQLLLLGNAPVRMPAPRLEDAELLQLLNLRQAMDGTVDNILHAVHAARSGE